MARSMDPKMKNSKNHVIVILHGQTVSISPVNMHDRAGHPTLYMGSNYVAIRICTPGIKTISILGKLYS
jgi:hypothetical protein